MSCRKVRVFSVRRAAALVCIVLAVPLTHAAQDAPESRDARGTIQRVQRLSENEGWALTDQALLFTDDGGASWIDMTYGQRLDGITDAFFLTASRAWLAGVDSRARNRLIVNRTADGGATWRERPIAASVLDHGETYSRTQIYFLDSAHGWLLGKVATSAAFSVAELLRTTDGGRSWERLPRPPAAGRFLFIDARHGFMTGAPVSERLYQTRDGGRSWQEVRLGIRAPVGMALYDLPTFHSRSRGTLAVTLRGDSPRLLTFETRDLGRRWVPASSVTLPDGDYDEPMPASLTASGRVRALGIRGSVTLMENTPRSLSFDTERLSSAGARAASVRALSFTEYSGWALVAQGGCEDGICRQVTRLVSVDASGREVSDSEDLLVRTHEDVQTPLSSASLSTGTVISFDKGFDKCAAATTGQMQTWKAFSPYKDANIYYGGSARACAQINLNPSWVTTVLDQGWRLIPTWVGPQAPCTGFSKRFSSNPTTAAAQGRSEADLAVAAAEDLGLGAGSPLYYDLELYAENNASCSAAVRAFVDAWSERVRALGYLAGVYGNARNAQADWRTGVIANPPDAVWLTPWVCSSAATSCNWTPTVFPIPGLNDAYWANNQRIRQYWGGHNETYGGVTFNIDSDYANAPVVGAGTSPSCQSSVPADRWKGEYFNNVNLSGSPVMVRDDGGGFLDFDWGTGSPGSSCGVPTDNFSARWTRTAHFNAGTYEFSVTSDDGFRLYVDGVLQMEAWIDQAPTLYKKNVTLSAGNHTVKLEYYERGGGAVAKLSWQAVSNPCIASVPSTSWKGEYFDNKTLSGSPVMVRNDGTAALDFEWYSDSPSPSCNFPADNFSVRWTRSVNFTAGTYRFTVTSDDGFRLYVDGALKLERWFDQGPTTYTVDVPLSAGSHTLRMDYYENGGWAVAKLSWQEISDPCLASVPSTSWKGEYFDNKTLSGSPVMVRNDGSAALDFEWYSDSPSPSCNFPADNFSVRWTRSVNFTAGTYRFTVTSDDGFRLYVDGALKLERWFDQGPTTYTVDVPLTAGNHTLRMDYYENGGWAVAKLSWQAVSTGPSVVVVDDLSSGFSRFGPTEYWWQASIGYESHMFWTYVNGSVTSNYARWTPNLASGGPGQYQVSVFVPRDNATSQQARYRIRHNGVDNFVTVNQSVYFDQWVPLGTYYFAAGGGEYVQLVDATGEAGSTLRKIGFDAVKFQK